MMQDSETDDPVGGSAAEGGCLCGAVRYRVATPLPRVVNCHCSMCRRWHGHIGAYTGAKRTSLHLQKCETLAWFRSSAGAERGFCTRCGSSLFFRPDSGDHIGITAGSLDQPSGLSTKRHDYVASRGDYYTIDDALEKREQG